MTQSTLQNFETFALERKHLVAKTLENIVCANASSCQKKLFDAASYALFPTGKLLRPLFAFAVAESFGIDPHVVAVPASCLELIHTYSLIHDDLPCMDDDDIRRGKPSLHIAYDEGHALLTGDFLLTLSFELLSTAPNLKAEQKLALIEVLSKKAGVEGMIGGQNLDISFTGQTTDWEMVEKMHIGKTAALIQASLAFGGIIANVSSSDRAILEEFGKWIGLSFQIIDDILDVTGNEINLGKPIGSDQKKQKMTAVSVLGLETAQEYGKKFSLLAQQSLHNLSIPCPYLEHLANQLLDRIS